MGLMQLVYHSKPFGFDQAILDGILLHARQNNTRDQITGALVCRGDIYLQLLEGPDEKVRAAFDRIKKDDRHLDVKVRISEPAAERLFEDWAMLHDPAQSWLWTHKEIADGALDRVTADDIRSVFTKLKAKKKPGPSA